MENKILNWIRKHRLAVSLIVLLLTLTGSLTFLAQKQDSRLPNNPINKSIVPSSVLLAGTDKEVSDALKKNGVNFKKNEEKQIKEATSSKETSSDTSGKHDSLKSSKRITTSKVTPKNTKVPQIYFTTTIKDGEKVETESYKFKILQKETDLKVEKQQVFVNDKEVDFSGIVLLDPGENKIEVVVTYKDLDGEEIKISKKYTVYFNNKVEIKTTLEDGKIVEQSTISFEAMAIIGEKEEPLKVLINQKEVSAKKNFEYSISLNAGENLIELVASSGKQQLKESYLVTYSKPKDKNEEEEKEKTEESEEEEKTKESEEEEKTEETEEEEKEGSLGKVIFTVEASTVGMNYLVPPTEIELKKDVPTPQYVLELLDNYGYGYSNTGSTKTNFYIESITGNIWNGGQPLIPGDLKQLLIEQGDISDSENIQNDDYSEIYQDPTSLGEFDFTTSSGWMYSVNGIYPGVGFSDYQLKDKDTVRIRYTLILGGDIGNSAGGNLGDW